MKATSKVARFFFQVQVQVLTPTFRNRSPTMLSADILADGVSGVPPFMVGMPAIKTQIMHKSQKKINKN